tara:strand:- start:252 stop:1313 length:1062 start_codon:yes stop_codon:yes gene_type:complete
MSQATLRNCKLLVDDKTVEKISNISFTESGNNQLQNLKATFTDPNLSNMSLLNKKVEFYLNNGSFDGAPIFRGYINQFRPSDTSVSITAKDVRVFLTGKNLVPIVIDEKDNYDGYTVVQFLQDYIINNINIQETLISTETLHEMDRPIFMTGERDIKSPYSLVKGKIEAQIDDETHEDRLDDNLIFDYFLDIIHIHEHSGITIRKSRNLDSYDFNFSYYDGIKSLSYTNRPPPSHAIASASSRDSASQVIFEYGNAPTGKRGMSVDIEGESRGEVKEKLISRLMLEQRYDKEINLVVTKGYHIGLGNIIRIDVPDKDISGNYRVTSKKVKYSSKGITCSLTCNNKPLKLSDYM